MKTFRVNIILSDKELAELKQTEDFEFTYTSWAELTFDKHTYIGLIDTQKNKTIMSGNTTRDSIMIAIENFLNGIQYLDEETLIEYGFVTPNGIDKVVSIVKTADSEEVFVHA